MINPTHEYEYYYLRKDSDLLDYLDDYGLINIDDFCNYSDYIINRNKLAEPIPKGYEPPVRETLGYDNVFEID